MTLLSVDQSLNHSGICINYNNEYIFDAIKFKKKELDEMTTIDKLISIRENLRNKIEIYCISLLIREGFSFGTQLSRSIFELGGLGYMIDLLCYDMHVEQFIIPPTVHKKFTTDRGNSPKSVMLLNIYKKWDIELSDDNIADAFSMMKTYEAYQKYLKGDYDDLTKAQLDVMKKMCKENLGDVIDG